MVRTILLTIAILGLAACETTGGLGLEFDGRHAPPVDPNGQAVDPLLVGDWLINLTSVQPPIRG